MSPREFHTLTKRFQELEERKDRRVATLQAFYLNCQTGSKTTADDFLGTRQQEKPKANALTNKQMERTLTTMFGVGPGKEKKETKKRTKR
jgi:hypothetical protein